MQHYVVLDKLMNLHDGYRKTFVVEKNEILLIQENGRRYLIAAMCPHSRWSMESGHIYGQEIICSNHGWSFNLVTGRAANQRAGNCRIATYRLAYEDNTVGILLN